MSVMHVRLGLGVGLLGLFLWLPFALTAQPQAPALDAIRESHLRHDVALLASDVLAGRGLDTDGNRFAGAFIANRFGRLGLTPVADGRFYAPFTLVTPTLGAASDNTLAMTPNGAGDELRLGEDFVPARFSATATASGPVVFAGFGVTAPALGHDDYGDLDLTGSVVLLLDHEPDERDAASPFDGTALSEHARRVRKTIEAQRRGAVAVLFAPDTHNHASTASVATVMSRDWPAGSDANRFELGAWVDQVTVPAVTVSAAVARQLVVRGAGAAGRPAGGADNDRPPSADGETPDPIWTAAAAGADADDFGPTALDVAVTVSTNVVRRSTPVHNVVGLLPGGDPALRHEWVILGAHYDHEGVVGTQVYPGADDNASGVAGLLAVAEAFARGAADDERPRRSILFAAWNAEERGLLGAWAYTEQPLQPLADVAAMINLDMIGRDEEVPARAGRRFRGLLPQTAVVNRNAVNVLGYSYSDDMRAAVAAANVVDLTVRFRYDRNASNLVRRSDHWPFLARGVPAVFIHTGLHPDYHTARDRVDALNYDKLTRITRLAYQLTWNLANADTRPRLNRGD